MNTINVPLIAERFLGAMLPAGIKCVNFVKIVYHEAGLTMDFSCQPEAIILEKLEKRDFGKLLFLMNRNKKTLYFSHVAIIYDENAVIHYSRHSSEDGVRRVQVTSFEELKKVYEIVKNPYVSKPLVC